MDHMARFRAGAGNGLCMGEVGERCARDGSELLRSLPPGDYDLEFGLGSRGIRHRSATIRARATTTGAVRVP